MNILINLLIAVLLIMFSLTETLAEKKTESAEQKNRKTTENSIQFPVFQPRDVGAPKVRVGGGSRGEFQTETELLVFAPEQIGLTIQNQPTLYWYVSTTINKPIEITITDKSSLLLKKRLDRVEKAGVQSLKLSEHDVYLQPSIKYQWSVAIINQLDQRSSDIFTSGRIMLLQESGINQDRLAELNDIKLAIIYAAEGLWYDAFDVIQRQVEKSAADKTSIKMRDSLLEQVGIHLSEPRH